MKYTYDLQSHSCFSDGDETPEELVKTAKDSGLHGLVLTDHNTTLGYERFSQACYESKLETIAGVEITARYEGVEIHILGYSTKFKSDVLQEGLRETINGYNERSRKLAESCKKTGLANLNFDEIFKRRPLGTYVTKYDIIKAIEKKTGKNKSETTKMLNAGGALHIPYGDWAMSPQQAVRLIHQANGIAILAHPGEAKNRSIKNEVESIKLVDRLIDELIKYEIDGLEIRHPKHNPADETYYDKIVKDFELIATGGSDWHGPYHHPDQKLGNAGLTTEEWKNFLKIIQYKTGNP
jgi:predicted metal-dependent phosphoesterase TrpH